MWSQKPAIPSRAPSAWQGLHQGKVPSRPGPDTHLSTRDALERLCQRSLDSRVADCNDQYRCVGCCQAEVRCFHQVDAAPSQNRAAATATLPPRSEASPTGVSSAANMQLYEQHRFSLARRRCLVRPSLLTVPHSSAPGKTDVKRS